MKTLLWKIRATYYCRKKLGISWRFAWQHAGAWIEQDWHNELSPRDAVEEEAYAWAADC